MNLFIDYASQQLYLISDGEYLKVGISSDPDSRVRALQTGHPKKLFVKFRFRLSDAIIPRTLENTLHRAMRTWRAEGGQEWFKNTVECREAFLQCFVGEMRSRGLNAVFQAASK